MKLFKFFKKMETQKAHPANVADTPAPYEPKQTYNVLLSLGTINDEMLMPDRWKSFHQSLLKEKIYSGELHLKVNEKEQRVQTVEYLGRRAIYKNRDIILKDMNALQLARMIEIIDSSPDLGSWRIHCLGSLRQSRPGHGKMLPFGGMNPADRRDLSWGEELPPIPIHREREPGQLWTVNLTLRDVNDENYSAHSWRDLYYQLEAKELTHSIQPEPGREAEFSLKLRRLQPEQLTILLQLIDSTPDMGSFVLSGGSDRRQPAPKSAQREAAESFIEIFKPDPKLIQQLDDYYNVKDQKADMKAEREKIQ